MLVGRNSGDITLCNLIPVCGEILMLLTVGIFYN